jgi:phosphoribosylformylglycinamidine synthase
LHDLGHNEVVSVRVDRVIHLDVEGDDVDVVRGQVTAMCEKVLANPVLEDFSVEVGA